MGKLGRCESKGPNFHYKIDKVSMPNEQLGEYNAQHCIRKLKIVKEVYLKCYHHLETKKVMMCGDREDN